MLVLPFRVEKAGLVRQKGFHGSYWGIEPKNLLGVKKILSHSNNTEFWYLLGVLYKTSDENPRPFCIGVSPGNQWESRGRIITAPWVTSQELSKTNNQVPSRSICPSPFKSAVLIISSTSSSVSCWPRFIMVHLNSSALM